MIHTEAATIRVGWPDASLGELECEITEARDFGALNAPGRLKTPTKVRYCKGAEMKITWLGSGARWVFTPRSGR